MKDWEILIAFVTIYGVLSFSTKIIKNYLEQIRREGGLEILGYKVQL
jgi:hypothetical protein